MKRVNVEKQTGVRQSPMRVGFGLLLLAGLTTSHAALATEAIVGSWYFDLPETHGVATFLGDGTYFEAIDVTGDSAHTGVEWGTYSWDAVSGMVTASSLGDTDGNWGFAGDVDGPQYVSISGNTATITQPGCSSCTAGSLARVLHPADSIVGTWLVPSGFQGTITFFADGSYIHGEEGHDGAPAGVERGTYSWDSLTGVLIATSIITDTNGESGLSNPQGTLTATFNASGVLTVTEGGIQHEVVAAPVPEPETYAMLLAGLGLVGWAVRRLKG